MLIFVKKARNKQPILNSLLTLTLLKMKNIKNKVAIVVILLFGLIPSAIILAYLFVSNLGVSVIYALALLTLYVSVLGLKKNTL